MIPRAESPEEARVAAMAINRTEDGTEGTVNTPHTHFPYVGGKE